MNRLLHFPSCILASAMLSIFLLTGCSSPIPKRGHNPWVFRTVLNEDPRMLVAALSDSLWVSYQTPFCGLSAVWRDGVSFDGPVYTTIQGEQPSSIGKMYIQNPPDSPWEIREGASAVFHKVIYTGHRIRNGKLELNYLFLTASGRSIRVKEIPEFVRNNKGMPGLQREFWVEDLPENHTIRLRTMLNSIPGRNYIQSNAAIQLTGPPAQPDSATLGLELLAIITLNNGSPTRLTTWFVHDPVIPNLFDAVVKKPEPNSGFALIERSGCKTCHDENQHLTGPSFEAIAQKYKTGVLTNQTLAGRVINGSTGVWGENVMIAHPQLKQMEAIKMVEWILSHDPGDQYGDWFTEPPVDITSGRPGDRYKVAGVHPSYDLTQARPDTFHPRTGGLDFLPDGRMVLSTWEGYVYLLGNLSQPDPEKISVKTIAEGLAEPLGLKVVEGKIYVLQKQELTLLIDHDGDEVTDEYANICNSWPVSANYHEFAFGLEYRDGFFYATLSSPLGKAETKRIGN